jgi:hypothetical protein
MKRRACLPGLEFLGSFAPMQTEVAALEVPVRFLYQLRKLLPQPAEDVVNEPTFLADSTDPAACVADAVWSASEDDSAVEADCDLQTAFLAALQMLAALPGI